MHRAKKSLGQNFLRSGSALKAIVSAGAVSASDVVLEIGPGKGALTEALLVTGARVIAVEKDRDLIPLLSEKFASYTASGKFHLLEDDVLEFDIAKAGLEKGKYKLIANIPYYITGAIFRKFLETDILPSCMVVLVQKEVAQRIVARDGKESILSISIKAFGKPKLVVKVPNTAFSPAPKVDSAVLLVENISHSYFLDWGVPVGEAIKQFFDIVHAGFAHKRKLLIRNLETVSNPQNIQISFDELGLSRTTRAEDIAPSVWLSLAKLLSQK